VNIDPKKLEIAAYAFFLGWCAAEYFAFERERKFRRARYDELRLAELVQEATREALAGGVRVDVHRVPNGEHKAAPATS